MTAEWRSDPFGRAQWRYHDGTAWTHHVSTDGNQSLESSDLSLTAPETSTPAAPDPSTFVAAAAYPPAPGYPAMLPGPAWQALPQRKGGRLIAAGVLGIVSSVVTVIGAIGVFAVLSEPLCADATFDESCRNTMVSNPGFIKTIMALAIIAALGFLVAGIGGCMRRYWGQRALIIVASLGIALDVIGIIGGLNPAAVVVNVIFCGVVIGLALANDRTDYELPRQL